MATCTSDLALTTLHQAMADDAPRLLALAYSVLHDRDQAADAVQDTLERALRFHASLREPERASAWLSTICVREARRRLRRQRLRGVLPLHHAGPAATVAAADPDLDRALRRLSTRQREVVALHYVYGYTLDETAAVLGCRPGTARRHLHRALDRLREEMSHD